MKYTIHSIASAALLLSGLGASLQASAQDAAGVITNVQGDVRIERGQENIKGELNGKVVGLDRVVTGKGASVGILLNDKTRLALGEKSTVLIAKYSFNPSNNEGGMALKVFRGTLGAITGLLGSKSSNELEVATPTTTAGIRGTEFMVEVKQND
jgi:hypothetical protein